MMTNNLINVVAKIYAGLMVIACLIFQVLEYDAEYLGVAAIVGMVAGFGVIMIGELVFEIQIHYGKWKFMKKTEVKREEITEEAAH